MRLLPTPCRVCFRSRVFDKLSHFCGSARTTTAPAGFSLITLISSLLRFCVAKKVRRASDRSRRRGAPRGVKNVFGL